MQARAMADSGAAAGPPPAAPVRGVDASFEEEPARSRTLLMVAAGFFVLSLAAAVTGGGLYLFADRVVDRSAAEVASPPVDLGGEAEGAGEATPAHEAEALAADAELRDEATEVESVEATAPASPEATTRAPPASTPTRITSQPRGAIVSRDGSALGRTPITLTIPEGESWALSISRPGYVSREVILSSGVPEVTIRLTRRPVTRPARPSKSTGGQRPSGGHPDLADPWDM